MLTRFDELKLCNGLSLFFPSSLDSYKNEDAVKCKTHTTCWTGNAIWSYCMHRTNNACFMQAKADHRENKDNAGLEYIIYTHVGVNCLKASIDKMKQQH